MSPDSGLLVVNNAQVLPYNYADYFRKYYRNALLLSSFRVIYVHTKRNGG